MDEQETDTLNQWLAKYGHTQRHFFLHPEQLVEITEGGAVVHHLRGMTLNDDDDTGLALAKERFFLSNYFTKLGKERQEWLVDSIGMSRELAEKFCRKRTELKKQLPKLFAPSTE